MTILDAVMKTMPEKFRIYVVSEECPSHYGYTDYEYEGKCCGECEDCWNREMEEEES